MTPQARLEVAASHLARLASAPRPAGGAAEGAARSYCRDVLTSHGFSIEEEPFAYSAFVGRWGTPLVAAIGLALFLAACVAGAGGSEVIAGVGGGVSQVGGATRSGRGSDLAAALLVGGGVLLGLGGTALARHGVTRWPTHRRSGVNLVARRGGAGSDAGRLWIVAHLDSKSQPVPILLRAAGIALFALAWLVALVLAMLGGRVGPGAWSALALLGAIAALPVILTTVGTDSPGALDNASGIATVLLTAGLAPLELSLGVLLTSAEELGLAGARGWARGRVPGTAVNVDGVDDGGALVVMRHGARARGVAATLASAMSRAAGAPDGGGTGGEPVRVRGLIPGVLTDGVALADTGWAVVTVSRGGIGTLARIHTRRDDLSSLAGSGVARTAALLARALPELA